MKENNINELQKIERIICEHLNLTTMEIKSKSRKREHVVARHLIMYFGSKYADCTQKFISAYLGRTDHTTTGHGVDTIEALRDSDFKFRAMTDFLDSKITETHPPDNIIYNWEVCKNVQNEF